MPETPKETEEEANTKNGVKNIIFTTARTVSVDAEYSEINLKVAAAKATIRNVRQSVKNKSIDFSDAQLQIQGVLKMLNALAEKTKILEEEDA